VTADPDVRHGRRRVFTMHVHSVFVTRYRRHVFDAAHLRHLETVLGKVCPDFEAELVESNGETDTSTSTSTTRPSSSCPTSQTASQASQPGS
jgi:hypothetical protein